MANEKRLTWKRSLDGYTDVGLCGGVTVDEAICKLADLEEKMPRKWCAVRIASMPISILLVDQEA